MRIDELARSNGGARALMREKWRTQSGPRPNQWIAAQQEHATDERSKTWTC